MDDALEDDRALVLLGLLVEPERPTLAEQIAEFERRGADARPDSGAEREPTPNG